MSPIIDGRINLPTETHPSDAGVQKNSARWTVGPLLSYLLLLVIIVFFALIRYRLRNIPLERDEGEFAYGGQLLLRGLPLYKHLYTLKMPGTYAAYAVILTLLGQTQAGIHIGLAFVNAATILLVFFFCARLSGRLAGLVAAASYALLSTSPSVAGFAGHATHFVALFAMGGFRLLLDALETKKSLLLFFSGVLLGVAFLMKQPGIFFLLWAALYLVWLGRATRWRGLAQQLAALISGSVLPFAVTCLLTWRSGSAQDLWFWTFTYARQYGTNANLAYGLGKLQEKGLGVIEPAVGIWLIAALGLTAFLWNVRARSNVFLAVSFFLCSFLAVCPGLYFREHYFIVMLPATSILAGMAVSYGTEMLLIRTGSRYLCAMPVLIFLVAFSSSIYRQRSFLFYLDPIQACKTVYGYNPFPEAMEISNYIESNTSKDATIAILGSEPEIYFYSHRQAATGHVCTYPILVPKYGLTLQKQMEEEIEKSKPEILVLVNDPASWVAFPNTASTDELLGWLKEYSRRHYTVDGVAEMDRYSTEYYWGERAERHPLSMARNIVILKRKPS